MKVKITTFFIKHKPTTRNCVPCTNNTGPRMSEGEELKYMVMNKIMNSCDA